jgi:hypothetical protein
MFLPFLFQQLLGSQSKQSDPEKQACKETRFQDPHRLPTSGRRRPSSINLDGNSLQPFSEDMEDVHASRTYRILPIFSGIMIPFSIMLLIPSLTGHWYVRTGVDNEVLEVRPNPLLLKLAMGLSLGCGVIASACLVARFSERNIKLATHLCISFLCLHGVLFLIIVHIFFPDALTQIS